MPPPEICKLLHDIQQACQRLGEFTGGKSVEDYLSDAMLRSAVERQFEIIGEALNQLLGRDEATAFRITDHRRIIAFRNRLVHGYATIDDEVVWGILETSLPRLRDEVDELLGEQG